MALEAGAILSAVAAVGATVAAVGVVTGDKELTKWGAILGGVGAIGSLAVGAGVFGANAGTTQIFGSSAAAGASEGAGAASGANFLDQAAAVYTPDAAGVAAAQATNQATSSLINGGAAVDTFKSGPAMDLFMDDAAAGAANGADAIDKAAAVYTSDATGAAAASGAAPVAAPSAPSVAAQAAPAVNWDAETMGETGGSNAPGFFDKFAKYLGDHERIAVAGMETASNLVGGLFDEAKPAQAAASRAQAALNQAQADMLNQQNANAKGPVPVARFRPRGIINNGMPAIINNIKASA
tara:strand:- start:699 stop:1586 length:888 start_codon:yes stop_codon:yes gene_type:complete